MFADHRLPKTTPFPRLIALSVLLIGSSTRGQISESVVAATNLYDCDAQSQIPVVECEALVALYNATNGPGWSNNTGWLADESPCSWHRVTCSSGHVTALEPFSNKLSGTIPSQLGDLSQLMTLNLYNNALVGGIPASLGGLGSLEVLRLSNNYLAGSLTPELGNLANLIELSLDVNQFVGSIPATFGNMGHLERLYLRMNNLSGVLPPELGKLDRLRTLDLRRNQIAAPLPQEIGDMNHLEKIYLSENALTGTISTGLCGAGSLVYLYLDSNDLFGEIPACLGALRQLIGLNLSNNRLTGEIPGGLGWLSQLQYLYLENNRLSGPIPSLLGKLTPTTRVIRLENNLLQEAVPLDFATLGAVAQSCDWTGNASLCLPDLPAYQSLGTSICGLSLDPSCALPPPSVRQLELVDASAGVDLFELEDGSILYLDSLDTSSLTIRAEVSASVESVDFTMSGPLTHSRLENNEPFALFGDSGAGYNGWLPTPGLYALTAQSYPADDAGGAPGGALSITFAVLSGGYDCTLQSEIPVTECEALLTFFESTGGTSWYNSEKWLRNVSPCSWYGIDCEGGHVSELKIESNRLTGTLPASLSDLQGLKTLVLSLDQLGGPIPPEIGSMTALEAIWLADSKLSGPIPPELGNLPNLRDLTLMGNQLSGPIPPELGSLPILQSLSLEGNMLTGAIPATLGDLDSLEYLELTGNPFEGSIPPELGRLGKLTHLEINYTPLTGPIPPELGNLSSLAYLELEHNNLTGPLPPELGQLAQLEALRMSDNQFTGPIPTQLAGLSKLFALDLANNMLSGPVPYTVAAVAAGLPQCRLTGNPELCMPDNAQYRELGDPICGLALDVACVNVPVELTSVEGVVEEGVVHLTWRTESETESAGFEVQHRAVIGRRGASEASSGAWTTLAFVESEGGATTPYSYSYAVDDLEPGTHRFRLKQIDLDGAWSLSPEVEVVLPIASDFALFEPYPNPADAIVVLHVTTSADREIRIEVFDVLGRRTGEAAALHLPANLKTEVRISTASLPSGLYFLRVTGAGKRGERSLLVRH